MFSNILKDFYLKMFPKTFYTPQNLYFDFRNVLVF